MNLLLVCVILFALWRGYAGMKKGMVDEIRMLLSLVISLFVLSLAILLYSSVKEKNTTNIILSVLMLLTRSQTGEPDFQVTFGNRAPADSETAQQCTGNRGRHGREHRSFMDYLYCNRQLRYRKSRQPDRGVDR